MFEAIKRANKNRKSRIRSKALEIAEENDWTFTGLIEPNPYTAEFVSPEDSEEPFYGWAIASVNNGDLEEEIDFAFGSGQMIFNGDYVLTDEDYYETIGAGI
jgi:hypothetical protein